MQKLLNQEKYMREMWSKRYNLEHKIENRGQTTFFLDFSRNSK